MNTLSLDELSSAGRSPVDADVAGALDDLMLTAANGPVPKEIIPGYRLEKSIGAGGFGEVFLATAPGDIAKAVKIVFGRLDESRAERELKALERIKAVRHPFVVSIDRIELADNRLVIVTELADRSMRDRFVEAQSREGGRLPGIPRDELLRYLSDAADALDYLSEKHSLQHLDIKPENLLLVDQHLKVGDFGLLKDLRDTQMSLMGGVTPTYAPPEVLEGQPGLRSDQYSLAVVYQEMLTGQLPFNGRTPGQLASQHLHSDPFLSPLPAADRYAIGRALAKSTERRFATCRELVDALQNPPKAALAKSPQVQTQLAADRQRRAATRSDARVSNSPLLRVEPRQPQVHPPLNLETPQAARPTVVVGVGGLGGEAVRRLRRDLARQFGSPNLPCAPLLAIDVDGEALTQLRRGVEADDADALQPHEVLHTPLRPAADYRDRRGVYLSWLSRRWLYNVPRTLRTEGMRPLGRLALIDNLAAVRRRIGELIDEAIAPAAAEQSQEQTGLAWNEGQHPVQVVLVGATTGGASSGQLIDLGYAVGELLHDRGINAAPHAVLLQAMPDEQRGERADLAKLNALALLGELYHFTVAGESYPGDGSGAVSAMTRRPFASTSLMQCTPVWNDQDDPRHPAEVAAGLLMQRILAPSAAFFETAAHADDDGRGLRGVGLLRLGGGRRATAGEADMIARQVLDRWIEGCRQGQRGSGLLGDHSGHEDDDRTLDRHLDELGIAAGCNDADSTAIDTAIAGCAELTEHVVAGAAYAPREKVFKLIHKAVGTSGEALGPIREAREAIGRRLAEATKSRINTLRRQLFAACPEGSCTVDDVRRRIFAIAGKLSDRLKTVQQQAQADRGECDRMEKSETAIDSSLVERLIRTRLHSQTACLEADAIQTVISAILETGRLFEAALTPLRQALATLPPVAPQFQPLAESELDRVERRAAAAATTSLGPFWLMTLPDEGNGAQLLAAVRSAAHDALRERSLEGSDEFDALSEATPVWANVAGSVRWLTTGPTDRAVHIFDDAVTAQTGHPPTALVSPGSDTVLCCEAGDLPIANVTAKLLEGRLDLLSMAGQLKSRQDIEWVW